MKTYAVHVREVSDALGMTFRGRIRHIVRVSIRCILKIGGNMKNWRCLLCRITRWCCKSTNIRVYRLLRYYCERCELEHIKTWKRSLH